MENYVESQHNLTDILRYSEEEGVADNKLYWAEVLLFDCLIGNTDRHHENWGIIESGGSTYFAPAFDNGIALGFRVCDEKLDAFNYDAFTKRFRFKIPLKPAAAKPGIKQVLDFVGTLGLNISEFVNRLDVAELAESVETSQKRMNPQLGQEYRLSDARKTFIIGFINHRKNHILECLNS